jgi:hypothetical protein
VDLFTEHGVSVVIDDQPFSAIDLGLSTVGAVLNHVKRQNRIVTTMLFDGEEPDLSHLADFRKETLAGHTLYVETCPPSELARDIFDAVDEQLRNTDALRLEAVKQLHDNLPNKAMEKLAGCFSAWQSAQQSVGQVASLMHIDLARVRVGDESLADVLVRFATQLRDIRTALENRDYVLLGDVIEFDAAATTAQWIAAIGQLREMVSAA